jgi:hypothetical protein
MLWETGNRGKRLKHEMRGVLHPKSYLEMIIQSLPRVVSRNSDVNNLQPVNANKDYQKNASAESA